MQPSDAADFNFAKPELDLFKVAMESAVVGLCLVSPEGQFLEVNPALCRLLGRREKALKKATWQELTHPDDLVTDQALVDDVKANRRQTYRLRKRFLRPDGEILWGDLNVGCVRNDDGSVRLFVSQIVDVSEAVEAQTALSEREQQYRRLVERMELATETVGLGIYQADLSSGGAYYSVGFLRNLGYEAGDWQPSQEEWFSRLHPDEKDTLEAAYLAVQDGSQSTLEYRMRDRNGRFRWFLGHGKGIDLDARGRARSIVGICLDITDRKLAEDSLASTRLQLEQERAELRATLDGLLEPHILLAPIRNSQGRIVDFRFHDANPAACAYNRLPRERLVGTTLLALLPAHQATGMLDHYIEAMTSGLPLVLDDVAYPTDFLGEERRYDIRAVRVGDLLSYSWRDVTERHRNAEQLKLSERRYRLLAENATDVVVLLRQGRIIWVAPSVKAVLGWEPEDWIGQPASDFLEPSHLSSYATHLDAIARGCRINDRHRLRAKDGSWHWMDTSAGPFVDEEGRTDGVLAVSRLVDAQVQAELALQLKSAELTSKLRTSLTASVVAHEINQPLSVILLQAQLALDNARQIGAAATPLRKPLATLIEATDRVVGTIERMRMLLRNVQTPLETVELGTVLGNALLYVRPQAQQQGVALHWDSGAEPLTIDGDPAQLQLAIANLIRNSLEALASSSVDGTGRIEVRLSRQASTIELRVGDNGPGFGLLDLDALPLTSTKRQGMGLGLFVVQTTTTNHGGTMTIGHSPLGGAEVRLSFPAAAP